MVLFSLPSRRSLWLPLDEMIRQIDTAGLDGLVYGDRGAENIYVGLARMKQPARGRGKETDVVDVPGIWLDVDVKAGGFESKEDAWAWVWGSLDSGPLRPQMVVESGGGLHLYWRTTSRLRAEDIRVWVMRMWMYAEESAGVKIDCLAEPTRVLRLPGTLWVGKGEDAVSEARAVKLVRCDDVPPLELGVLGGLTETAWEGRRERIKELRTRRERRAAASFEGMDARAIGLPDDSWAKMALIDQTRDFINERVPWAEILEPYGWTKYGEPDAEGHQQWTRPGEGEKNPRSLVTDWVESPDVAKLLSDSPETGLLELAEEGRPLTKVAVAAALGFDGDEVKMIEHYARTQFKKMGETWR